MKELSEIIQVDNGNSMNQVDSKTAIQYVVESGMDKARNLIQRIRTNDTGRIRS